MISTQWEEIRGVNLDPQTRCGHYRGPTDIVAIKFKCCGTYWACKDCHLALADHPIEVWPAREREVVAIRCGACSAEQTIAQYLTGGSRCPACGASFNPRCERHHHLYFEVLPPPPHSRSLPGDRSSATHTPEHPSCANRRLKSEGQTND